MSEITISIPRINCNGCIKNVRRVLEALPGVEIISTELSNKTIHLCYNPAQTPLTAIRQALTEARYPMADEQPVEQ